MTPDLEKAIAERGRASSELERIDQEIHSLGGLRRAWAKRLVEKTRLVERLQGGEGNVPLGRLLAVGFCGVLLIVSIGAFALRAKWINEDNPKEEAISTKAVTIVAPKPIEPVVAPSTVAKPQTVRGDKSGVYETDSLGNRMRK